MNGKRKDMPIWLLENLEKNTFQGLKWEEKEKLTFKIVWERNQTHNSELTMEICKAYDDRTERSRDISPPSLKNKFFQALKKSPGIILLNKETTQQSKNYLLCQFNNLSCDYVQEFFQIHDILRLLPHNQLNEFEITVEYDSAQCKPEKFNLSVPTRFHFGDARLQLETISSVGDERAQHFADCEAIKFPSNNNAAKEARALFEDAAAFGIVLGAENGTLMVKRLCQSRVYCQCPTNKNDDEKLNRYELKRLFSYEDYIAGLLRRSPTSEKIVLSFGSKVKAGPIRMLLIIKPILLPFIKATMEIGDASMSVSLPDSLDRENLMQHLMQTEEPY